MSSAPRLSVAVPAYNEQDVLPELLDRLGAVLDALPGGPHEIVVVDDGSSDGTLAILERAAARDARLVVVVLSRNFGHQAALAAALEHASGDVAVVMDADLQDPPEVIPTLLERYRQGYDVVYVQRVRRKEAWWLRLAYYVFYRLLARLSGVRLPVDAGDFALMSAPVIRALRRMPEHHRYLRGLRTWAGFRQVGVPVERARRTKGDSKYGLLRLFALAFDGIFAFAITPLRIAAALGAAAVGLSCVFAVYSLYAKLVLHRSPQGFTALILVITFLSGVNLFFLGLMGEYLGRVYEEVKGRPLYIVGRVIRRSAAPAPAGAADEGRG